MTSPNPTPSCEDVLDAFAAEPDHGQSTLDHYLRNYPQYATELVELSQELAQPLAVNTAPLSEEDYQRIELAWLRHLDGFSNSVLDPFASLTVANLRAIAKQLNVPRQILAAFRERKVIASSIPKPFLGNLAAAMNTQIETVLKALSLPPTSELARSYKADTKPETDLQVTFEQLLKDASVAEDQRARLMAD